MHVIVNVCTLPLASNPKVPKYSARTRAARTSLCPSTIPSAASSYECSGDGSSSSPEGQELESDAALPPLAPAPDQETEMEKTASALCLAAPFPRQSQGHRIGPRRSSCRSTRQPSHAVRRDLPVFSYFRPRGPPSVPRFSTCSPVLSGFPSPGYSQFSRVLQVFPVFPGASRLRGTPRVPKFSKPSLVF